MAFPRATCRGSTASIPERQGASGIRTLATGGETAEAESDGQHRQTHMMSWLVISGQGGLNSLELQNWWTSSAEQSRYGTDKQLILTLRRLEPEPYLLALHGEWLSSPFSAEE